MLYPHPPSFYLFIDLFIIIIIFYWGQETAHRLQKGSVDESGGFKLIEFVIDFE